MSELDGSFAGQIALIAHEQLVDIVVGVAVNLVQPLLHVVIRLQVGGVVDDDDAVCAAVVGRRDGAEALLSRRIPDLQLDGLGIQLDGTDLEVDADGGDVGLGIGVVGEAQQQTRLACWVKEGPRG